MVDVDAFPTLTSAATAGERHDAFTALSTPRIADLLTGLADRVRQGRYPAGRPYRHVNGFTKIVVAEYPCATRLTLHYWPADPGSPEDVSRPHDHRFAFSSILLGGEQRFVELEESDDRTDGPWLRYRYRPYLQGRFATVAGGEPAQLRPVRTVARRPLDGHYTTTSTVVHQAVTRRDVPCVTLVLRGPRERRTSQVYYRPAEPAPRGGLQVGRYLPHDLVREQVDHAAHLVSTM